MKKELFGKVKGKEVYVYKISNGKITAKILNLGGIVQSLIVNGLDVVLGYNDLKGYLLDDTYFGAIIGRVGNRIGNGKFTVNGKNYQTTLNDNGNCLHGGINGFNTKIWNVEDCKEDKLVLTYVSKDNEEGFPGELKVKVIYTVTKENGLKIEYLAESDKDTVCNLTNHSYFNLNGEGSGSIENHLLRIDADKITPTNEELITFNTFRNVFNTPFDFNEFKKIGKDINEKDKDLINGGGYDINFCLNNEGFREVATVIGDKSNIKMKVLTDQKGLQFYSANMLTEKEHAKTGKYGFRQVFCLETQNYPNAVNCPDYPSSFLKKGEKYNTITEYRFFGENL